MVEKNPSTVAQKAPEPQAIPVQQVKPTIERQGSRTVPVTRRWPQVRGGICEYCGIIDPNVRSEDQYKLCPHFRDIGQLRCSYCDESKNPDDIVYHSVLNIAAHPDNPNKLIVWCNSYTCSQKHEKRFLVSQ
jgi:hypothetical protein